jgi:hypothetical protein
VDCLGVVNSAAVDQTAALASVWSYRSRWARLRKTGPAAQRSFRSTDGGSALREPPVPALATHPAPGAPTVACSLSSLSLGMFPLRRCTDAARRTQQGGHVYDDLHAPGVFTAGTSARCPTSARRRWPKTGLKINESPPRDSKGTGAAGGGAMTTDMAPSLGVCKRSVANVKASLSEIKPYIEVAVAMEQQNDTAAVRLSAFPSRSPAACALHSLLRVRIARVRLLERSASTQDRQDEKRAICACGRVWSPRSRARMPNATAHRMFDVYAAPRTRDALHSSLWAHPHSNPSPAAGHSSLYARQQSRLPPSDGTPRRRPARRGDCHLQTDGVGVGVHGPSPQVEEVRQSLKEVFALMHQCDSRIAQLGQLETTCGTHYSLNPPSSLSSLRLEAYASNRCCRHWACGALRAPVTWLSVRCTRRCS